MPDYASVRVSIDGEGDSQEEAFKAARKLARAVDGVLDEHRAALGHVVTDALAVQPKSRWRKGETVRTGWRASRSTQIEITAVDEVGGLVAALALAGGAVLGPWWELDPANAAHDAVRGAAAHDARRRAATYADSLGLVAGAVAWIAEPGLRSSTRGDWLGGMGVTGADLPRGGGETIPVTPEQISLTAAVEVGFELEAQGAPAKPD